MKALFTSVFFACFLAVTGFGQQASIDDVVRLLKKGDAAGLAARFDDNVGITLPSKSDNYSKAAGAAVLKDFFAANAVSDFEMKHKGDSPGGHYCIGTLKTKSGSYRAHIFLKTKGGAEVIKELRFQPIE